MNNAHRFSRFCASALTATAILVAPAHACYKVEFINDSKHDVTAVWTAFGCAGVHKGIVIVCHEKETKAGGAKSYDYNWGVTKPVVIVYNRTDSFGAAITIVEYDFNHDKFAVSDANKPGSSPDGCDGRYTVHFTESDYRQYSF